MAEEVPIHEVIKYYLDKEEYRTLYLDHASTEVDDALVDFSAINIDIVPHITVVGKIKFPCEDCINPSVEAYKRLNDLFVDVIEDYMPVVVSSCKRRGKYYTCDFNMDLFGIPRSAIDKLMRYIDHLKRQHFD